MDRSSVSAAGWRHVVAELVPATCPPCSWTPGVDSYERGRLDGVLGSEAMCWLSWGERIEEREQRKDSRAITRHGHLLTALRWRSCGRVPPRIKMPEIRRPPRTRSTVLSSACLVASACFWLIELALTERHQRDIRASGCWLVGGAKPTQCATPGKQTTPPTRQVSSQPKELSISRGLWYTSALS